MKIRQIKDFTIIKVAFIIFFCFCVNLLHAETEVSESGKQKVNGIDTTYFNDQIRLAGNFVNASEFDSCLLISSSNVTELTNKLKLKKIKTS
ncbi:MAG: hypothetical protein IPI23_21365 [Bacteroidetes bacterium]|nr:hypothetical protein [Bacteroidota bacterium]